MRRAAKSSNIFLLWRRTTSDPCPWCRTIFLARSREPPGIFNSSFTPWAKRKWASTASRVGPCTWPASLFSAHFGDWASRNGKARAQPRCAFWHSRFSCWSDPQWSSATEISSLRVPADMRLSLPKGTFQAYLFDCDGTVADSMPLHYVAWRTALAEWHCPFSEELFYSWGGFPVAKIISLLNEKHNLQMPVEEVAHRKEQLYYDQLPQLQPVPEVLEHIE